MKNKVIFYQNYFDEMALRISLNESNLLIFEILRKGTPHHAIISPYTFDKVVELKQKEERSNATESLYFALLCTDVEGQRKLLIINIYNDRIIKIKDKTLEMSKYIQNRSRRAINDEK